MNLWSVSTLGLRHHKSDAENPFGDVSFMAKPNSDRRATRTSGKEGRRRPPAQIDNEHEAERDADFADLAARTIARSDNAAQVARIMAERDKARRQRDEWKEYAGELEAEIPEGSVVLTDKEAEAIKALRERNVDLTKVHTLLETLENDKATLTADNLRYKQSELYGDFEKTSGYNKDAVAALVNGERLHAEMGDVTIQKQGPDGKATSETKKTLKVRKAADPKAALVSFDEYVESNAKWAWPSLKTKPAASSQQQQHQQTAPNFSSMTVEQGSTTQHQGTGNPVADFRQRRNAERAAQPNPLQFGAQRVTVPPPTGRRGSPTGQ